MYTPIIIKKFLLFFFIIYKKMDQENIIFMGNQDNSYTMVDLYQNNRFFGYKESYDYYEIDVNKTLLFLKSNNKCIIRYYDVNKMAIVPLQLKIKKFYSGLHNGVMFIHYDDKEFFRKCGEIWNKIIELIGINNPEDFVETTLDDDAEEFIKAVVYKNTSFVEGNYRNKVVIVLHSVFIKCLQTSLVQCRY